MVLLVQSTLISFFLCVLVFKMIHSSIQENPSDFIYFLGFAAVMLSKISIPHYYGQQIISKSEEIVNALYEAAWYEKDGKQRKNLVLMMIRNQKTLKINVKGFYDLDLKNLGLVRNKV
jgi:7tm Odorant receptor